MILDNIDNIDNPLNPVANIVDKKYVFRKGFMDFLFPAIILAITLIWKDFIVLSVQNFIETYFKKMDSDLWSAFVTGLVLTALGFFIAFKKMSWDEEYEKIHNVSGKKLWETYGADTKHSII